MKSHSSSLRPCGDVGQLAACAAVGLGPSSGRPAEELRRLVLASEWKAALPSLQLEDRRMFATAAGDVVLQPLERRGRGCGERPGRLLRRLCGLGGLCERHGAVTQQAEPVDLSHHSSAADPHTPGNLVGGQGLFDPEPSQLLKPILCPNPWCRVLDQLTCSPPSPKAHAIVPGARLSGTLCKARRGLCFRRVTKTGTRSGSATAL